MKPSHCYDTRMTWMQGRKGLLENDDLHPFTVASPPEFKGEPGHWTPEHLLVAAVESCLMTTYLAIAEMSHLEVLAYRSSAQTELVRGEGKGFRFSEVVVRPVIEVAEADRERALRLMEKAEKHCFVSAALTVPVHVEAQVVTVNPQAVQDAA
jgi:organic hydroperoxide reductase OsmC/OhrA